MSEENPKKVKSDAGSVGAVGGLSSVGVRAPAVGGDLDLGIDDDADLIGGDDTGGESPISGG